MKNAPSEKNRGANLLAIAYSKAAEMAETLKDSGSAGRPPMTGETGWQGGLIRKGKTGYLIAAFSGGPSEADVPGVAGWPRGVGRHVVTDGDEGARIWADWGRPHETATLRSSGKKEAHIHPSLSPDGKIGFFNSDESGVLQAYLVRGI